MSKQIKNEVEETKNNVVEMDTVETISENESTEEESKIEKLWSKIKNPVIIGAAAIGGFILGKVFTGNNDDDIVVEYDDFDKEVDKEVDENETE